MGQGMADGSCRVRSPEFPGKLAVGADPATWNAALQHDDLFLEFVQLRRIDTIEVKINRAAAEESDDSATETIDRRTGSGPGRREEPGYGLGYGKDWIRQDDPHYVWWSATPCPDQAGFAES